MQLDEIKQIVDTFFEKLNVDIKNLEINLEEVNIFSIKIETVDSSLLIWYSGKNLEDIRTILKSIISKKVWENIILHLEVNDYLSKKDDKLFNFILKKIDILKSSWKEIVLPFFNAYDRKKIHKFVASLNDENIFTKSVWEWKNRRLHLCKKSQNLTIDIYWIDI